MRLRHLLLLVFVLFLLNLNAQDKSYYSWIENKGQWPESVISGADLENGKLFLEKNLLTFHFYDISAVREAHGSGKQFSPEDIRIKGHVYKVEFGGCNSTAPIEYSNIQKTTYNYFLGSDEHFWAGGCRSYGKIIRKEFYPGIDFHLYSNDFFMKYDFVVSPNANTNAINMTYEGVNQISVEDGRIKVQTSINTIWEQKPIAWQFIKGKKTLVACKYAVNGNSVKFEFPNGYNHEVELVIDPEIVFSTYSGSTSDNFGYTATYDEQGYLYSGSSAFGQGYPTTTGAYETTHQGGSSTIGQGIDMALSKYDVTGSYMVWSTFLGGSGDDLPHSIITNSQSELMVYGTTGSSNFPVTSGAFDNSFASGTLVSPTGTGAVFPTGTDIVLAHFNYNADALLGSTYIGGTGNDGICVSSFLKRNYADEFRGEISLDENENIIVASSTLSTSFPVVNAYQPTAGGGLDAVLFKISDDMSTMFWSTYLGGTMDDSGFSVSINSSGELYLCGGTRSENFPTTTNTVEPAFNGGNFADGYIAKFDANGQSLMASTFWGTPEYDQLYFLEIDNEDLVYVYGQTFANDTEMIINAGYGTPNSGNLITKFNPDLTSVIWSTVFGTGSGQPNLSPSAFLVDCGNRVYISGWGSTQSVLNPGSNLTSMVALETTSNAVDNSTNGNDFYLAVFDENMSSLQYGSFYGGNLSPEHVDGGTSRFDRKGIIYQSVCAGCAGNSDFPIYPANAWSATNNAVGGCNNAVFKFDYQLPLTHAAFSTPGQGCINQPYSFNNESSVAENYYWDFGDQNTSQESDPIHYYDTPGDYEITLIASDPDCGSSDTATLILNIQTPQAQALSDLLVCQNTSQTIGPSSTPEGYNYAWLPSDYLNSSSISNPIFTAGASSGYTVLVSHDACIDTLFQNIIVPNLTLTLPQDTVICDDIPLVLSASYSPNNASIIWSDNAELSTPLNDNETDPDIAVNVVAPSTYFAGITAQGCTLVDSVFVNLVSFQTIIEGDFTTCIGDTVQLSVLDPNPEFSYAWSPENLIVLGQNTSEVLAYIPEETTFTVYSTTSGNCTASDEVTVTVSNLNSSTLSAIATPDIVVQGQTTVLHALPDGYTYTWSPPAGLNNIHLQSPLATPEQTTTYYVTASDGECSATASVKVRVVDFVCGPPSIYIPNVFTPNADNRNDKLFVRGNNISKLYFVIYDRWGEKIFETENIDRGWDGKFEGREVDPDVYAYYLEATCAGGEDYFEEGNITVVR